jgi:hypothetical protein
MVNEPGAIMLDYGLVPGGSVAMALPDHKAPLSSLLVAEYTAL